MQQQNPVLRQDDAEPVHGSETHSNPDTRFVLHAFVEASVPECLLGVVLAHIDENFVTDRAWTIPAMNIVTT